MVGPVGPCITGIIDNRDQPDLEQGMVIEEGSIPGALADYLPRSMLATASGIDTDPGLADRIEELGRELDSLVLGPYRGAVRNTQTYLVMSHDDGNGHAVLEEDRLRIRWPDVGGSVGRFLADRHPCNLPTHDPAQVGPAPAHLARQARR